MNELTRKAIVIITIFLVPSILSPSFVSIDQFDDSSLEVLFIGSSYFNFFSRSYSRCLKCSLIYKESQESYEKTLIDYRENYFGKYYAVEVEGGRNKLFNHILDLIEENRGISSLLDVGTSCGFFLVSAQKRCVSFVPALQRRFPAALLTQFFLLTAHKTHQIPL